MAFPLALPWLIPATEALIPALGHTAATLGIGALAKGIYDNYQKNHPEEIPHYNTDVNKLFTNIPVIDVMSTLKRQLSVVPLVSDNTVVYGSFPIQLAKKKRKQKAKNTAAQALPVEEALPVEGEVTGGTAEGTAVAEEAPTSTKSDSVIVTTPPITPPEKPEEPKENKPEEKRGWLKDLRNKAKAKLKRNPKAETNAQATSEVAPKNRKLLKTTGKVLGTGAAGALGFDVISNMSASNLDSSYVWEFPVLGFPFEVAGQIYDAMGRLRLKSSGYVQNTNTTNNTNIEQGDTIVPYLNSNPNPKSGIVRTRIGKFKNSNQTEL